MKLYGASVICDCGGVMWLQESNHPLLPEQWLECPWIECKNYGKRFRELSVSLVEFTGKETGR